MLAQRLSDVCPTHQNLDFLILFPSGQLTSGLRKEKKKRKKELLLLLTTWLASVAPLTMPPPARCTCALLRFYFL